MRLDIAAQTDIGRRKRKNEDSYGVFREGTPGLQLVEEGALLCVADGLGGHGGGEIASKLAVTTLRDALKDAPPLSEIVAQAAGNENASILAVLGNAIARANENVHRTNQDYITGGRPMGTTLLAVLIHRDRAYIANVGDSRCYHVREGEILAKTEDHSWVDEQVKLGLMTTTEAESDARKNIVTRCIGTHAEVHVDTYVWDIAPGDKLMLCTDGLVNMAKDAEIVVEFRKGGTPAEIVQRLVNVANDNGGRDNITVIAAHISPNLFQFLALRLAAFWRRRFRAFILILAALLYGAACFAAGYYLRGLGVLEEFLNKLSFTF